MAQKVQFSWFSDLSYRERDAIDQNANELDEVAGDVKLLGATVRKQAEELLRLRAFVMGVVEVLHAKAPFDNAELERAVEAAWASLRPPPPDPNRNLPKPPVRDERPVTCAKCGKSVPAYRTNITATGEVCDACV